VALIRSLPNTLIGLGILGTFVGLSMGVLGLKTQGTPEEIQEGIVGLLGSMSTAFVTSVFGMAGSILSSIWTRWIADGIGNRHSKWCNELDRAHYLEAREHRKLRQNEWREMFEEFFAIKVDGRAVMPGVMMDEIRLSGQQTVEKLDAFSADLADGLHLSSQTMEVFNNMASSLNSLEQKGAQDQESFVGELRDALGELIEGFKSELTGGANEQIEALNGVMGSTVSGLQQLPQVLQTTEAGFRDMMEQIQRNLIDGAGTAAKAITAQTAELGDRMNDVVQEVMGRQEHSAQAVEQLLDRVRAIMEEGREGHEALSGQVQSLVNASSALNEGVGAFRDIAGRLRVAGERLDSSSETLASASEKMGVEREALDNSIRITLEQATSVMSDYEGKFRNITESLDSAFGVFNEGMKNYERTANETISSTLESFASSLGQATVKLKGAFDSLARIVETLEDVLDKRNSR
jgi:ABC-type transporter Mla subunit MlaD